MRTRAEDTPSSQHCTICGIKTLVSKASPWCICILTPRRAFKIELFDNTEPQPTSAFCDSFVNALVAMPKLSELNLNLGDQSKSISTLGKAFKSSNATLPTIQTLELRAAPKAAFILKACPSLKTFIAFHIEKGWKSTFAPLPSMETIRQVEIDTSQNWTLRRLQGECFRRRPR